MKKNLLCLSIITLSALTGFSQITINSTDVPTPGTNYLSANDTTQIQSISVGGSGNQNWNFSSLSNDDVDTNSMVSPSNVPGGADFPNATLATTFDGTSVFYSGSSTSLDMLGYYADFGFGAGPIEFTPPQTFITFPSTYQTAFNGTSGYELKSYYAGDDTTANNTIDSIKIISTTTYTSSMDGWGTITTPVISNVSCLRQKVTEVRKDSSAYKLAPMYGGIWMGAGSSTNSTVSYRWWTNTYDFPVVNISTNLTGDTIESASYLLAQGTGINESVNSKNISVFPNPSQDKLYIAGADAESTFIVFDATGRTVANSELKGNNSVINVSGFENGLYFYQVTGKKGDTLGNGKFAVSK